jgi:phage repressor protein C with HTH and peptisase S24 domain
MVEFEIIKDDLKKNLLGDSSEPEFNNGKIIFLNFKPRL